MREVKCVECGSDRVVNKHFKLCQHHNELRLNNGKTKQQVYSERQQSRNSDRIRGIARSVVENRLSTSKVSNVDVVELKNRFSIKKISKTSRYRCSDGTILSQFQVNTLYAQTCDQIKQERPAICQGTGRSDVPLSFSHTISRARCKELGKAELIFDPDNIEIEGFEAPTSFPTAAHNIWESGNLDQKRKLLNFNRKLEYIKKHDQETFNKLTL